jgi:hypothetical protein
LLEYSTVSKELANGVVELLRGLNKQVYFREMIRKDNSSYALGKIFRISELKGYSKGLKIVDIVNTGKITEMMCIKVSNKDSLYITNDYVVTHNTTSTTILTNSLIQNSFQEINKGYYPMDIARYLKESEKELLEELKNLSTPISEENIIDIAMVASNGDKFMSELVAKAFKTIGKDGLVSLSDSRNYETTLEATEGIKLDRSHITESFFLESHFI